jgi:hypothetical protein
MLLLRIKIRCGNSPIPFPAQFHPGDRIIYFNSFYTDAQRMAPTVF